VNCQPSQPPRPGQGLLDVPGAADGGAAPLPRRCTMTPRLTTVCAADGERGQKRPDAAICHLGLAARKALPRSRAAERHTYFVHTQDGRIHLPNADTTPDPLGKQGRLVLSRRVIRLPDAHASRRGQRSVRREHQRRSGWTRRSSAAGCGRIFPGRDHPSGRHGAGRAERRMDRVAHYMGLEILAAYGKPIPSEMG
jgi:hypothetical protein